MVSTSQIRTLSAESVSTSQSRTLSAESVRQLFEIPEGDVYLACASRAPLATRTFDAGVRATALKKHPWTFGDGAHGLARESFAKLINCAPCDVALCPSTSFALTTAARAVAIHMRAGDVGLILEDQMSSNTYPWQNLQDTHGLDLQAVAYPSDGNWTAALLNRLAALEVDGSRVAVVAIPIYLWTDCSGPIDLSAVSKVCRDTSRQMRTILVVDATQSVGAVPIDVQSTPVDFLAASVHKWLFGAYGLSCLFVAPHWSSDLRLAPLVEDEHPRAHMANGDDEAFFDLKLPGYPKAYVEGAARLDSGGRPNPIVLPMAIDGMKMVLEWGPERIAAALAPLTKRIHDVCTQRLGLWVPPNHGPHFLGVGPGPADGCSNREEVAAWLFDAACYLKTRRIYVTARLKVLRVAPHLYTTIADVDRFLEVLADFVRERRNQTPPARL